ncbi:MAG: hypothetical protein FJ161_04185, partial [Gammaproteobacteria bacterium]|nr:hypothetical protein [Gammaproteobacteria bacterium]
MFSLLSFFQSEKSQSGIFHNILSLIRKIATSCTSGINKVDGVMRHMTARISQWQYQAVKHYRNKSYPIRSFINRFVSPTPARYHRIEYARWYDANTDANPSKLPFDSLYKSFLFFELIGIMIDNTIISITKFLLVYPLVTINNLLVNAMVNTRLGQFILLPILEETFNNQHNYYSFHDFDRDQELVTWQSKHTCDIADFVPNSIGFKEDGYELDELINRAIERFRPIAYLNDFLLSFTKQVLANGTVNTLRRLIINILNLLITSVVIVGLELFNMLIKPALIAIADRLCFIANIVINGVTEGCNILLRAIPIIWSYIKYPSIIVFFGIMYMTNPLVFWIVTGSVASVIGTVVLIRAYKKLAELSNRYIPERIRTVLKNLAIFLYKDIITQAFDLVIGFFGLIKSLSTIPFVSIIKSIYAISIEIKDIIAADFAYSKTTTPVISVDTVANNAKSSVEHIENADATQLEIKAIISEVNTLSNISETSEQASTAVTEEIKTPKEPLSVINTNAEPTEQKQDSNPKLELKLNPEPELNIADNTLTEITLSKPNQSTESFAMLGIGPFELSYQPKSNDNEFIAISRYKGFELSYNATQGRKYYELFCNKEVPHYLTQGIHHQKLYFDWIQRNVQNAANLSDLLLSIAGTFSFNPGIINQYFHDNKYKLMCYILNKDDITQIIIEDRKYVYNMILNPEYYLSNNIDAAVYLAINASGSYNNSRWIASIISSTPIAALLNQVKTIIKAKFITEFVLGLPLEFEKFIGNLKPRKQPKITKIIHRFAAVSTLRYQWFGHLWKHHYQIESLQWIGMVASWGPNLKIFGVNLFPTLSFGYAATTIKNFEKLYNNNKETIKANSAQFTLLTVFCLLMATTWSARSYSYTPATIPALNVYYDMFLYPLLTWMIIKEGLAENIMSIYYKGGIKKILSKNAMHIIADSKSDTNNDLARADNTPMGLPDQFVTVISVYGYFIANMLSNASKLMPPFSVQIFKHNSYILIAMMMLALSKTNIFHIDPIYLYLLKNAADIYVANSSIVYKSDTSPFHHPSMYLFLLDTTLLGVASRAALMYGATWSKQLYFKAHPKNEQSKEQKAQNASTQRQFYGLTLALAIFLCAYAFGIHKALPFANQHSLAQYTIMPM